MSQNIARPERVPPVAIEIVRTFGRSPGFDAHLEDPISDTTVTAECFHELARRCAALAPRVAAVLEGGYNLATLPRLVENALAGFEAEK